ncbi:MAG: sigma-70 family RNA polymerase sigma factor [Nocardioidaceae bacterium]
MTAHGRPPYEASDPNLIDYLNAIGRIPLLTPDDEIRLGRVVAEGQDARSRLDGAALPVDERTALAETVRAGDEARTTMVRANLRLVVTLARRHGGRHVPLLDLIQEGNIGLMRAVEKFDYRRALRFSTYAAWWIRQAVSRAAPDHRTIRVPQDSYSQMIRCVRARAVIEERSGRPGTDREIADEVGLSETRVRDLLRSAVPPLALDVGDDTIDLIADRDTDPWLLTHRDDVRRRLAVIIGSLPEESRTVVRLRYGFDGPPCSLTQVSKRIGVPPYVVRQIEGEALDLIRQARDVDELDLDEPA